MNTLFNPDWCKTLRLSTGEYLVAIIPDMNTVDTVLGKCVVLLKPIRVNLGVSNEGSIQVQFLKFNPHSNDNYYFIPAAHIISMNSVNSEMIDHYLKAFKDLSEQEDNQATLQEQAKKKFEQLGKKEDLKKEDIKKEEEVEDPKVKVIKKGKKSKKTTPKKIGDYVM